MLKRTITYYDGHNQAKNLFLNILAKMRIEKKMQNYILANKMNNYTVISRKDLDAIYD